MGGRTEGSDGVGTALVGWEGIRSVSGVTLGFLRELWDVDAVRHLGVGHAV